MIEGIKKVCFVGAGTMGAANSFVAAASGYDVVIYDVSEKMLKTIPERYGLIGQYLTEHPSYNKWQSAEEALSRVTLTSDPSLAARDADLLSESVPERLELKRKIHQQFDSLCPSKTIMTTNTSWLSVSAIETAILRENRRFAAMHYHLVSRLVDIMKGARTSAATVETLRRYILSCHCIPLVTKKENPGYVYNSLLYYFLWKAEMLVLDGEGSTEDVDRAWIAGMKPWSGAGPFGIMDVIGLDVVYDGASEASDDPGRTRAKTLAFLKSYVGKNELGVKTDRGFYNYPDPAFVQADFLNGVSPNDPLCKALVTTLIARALVLAIEGVADVEDIDRAWMLACESINADIGPFGLLDQRGLDTFLCELDETDDIAGVFGISDESYREKIDNFLTPYIKRGALGVKTGQGFYSYPEPNYRKPRFFLG